MVDPGMRKPRPCRQIATLSLKKERWLGTEPYTVVDRTKER